MRDMKKTFAEAAPTFMSLMYLLSKICLLILLILSKTE
jgi:hypothetical protein